MSIVFYKIFTVYDLGGFWGGGLLLMVAVLG